MSKFKAYDSDGRRIAGSGLSRLDCQSWEYQWEPFGVTHALVLRHVMEENYSTDEGLFWAVWDDLVQCLYWTSKSPQLDGEPTYVFKHGQGSKSAQCLRSDIRSDLERTLKALKEDGVIEGSQKKGWRLTSYKARAEWLAARTHEVVVIYRANIGHGAAVDDEIVDARSKCMEIFHRNGGTLRDEDAEALRNYRLDVIRQRHELAEAEARLVLMEKSHATKIEI